LDGVRWRKEDCHNANGDPSELHKWLFERDFAREILGVLGKKTLQQMFLESNGNADPSRILRMVGITLTATQEDHSFFIPPGASRSPCPALNTLANHGYLPRDGHAITFKKLVDSLTKVFGLSYGFAFCMTFGTFLLLRHPG
jgi:hypothetical protein